MFQYEQEAAIEQDREDLIGLLKLRFGTLEPQVIEAIYQLDDYETIERLILVGANAPDFKTFLEELEEGKGTFRIVGERFNPLESIAGNGDTDGTKQK
ncbi:hypothetical protein FH966_09415 [Lentibacillus cibarius]|uniref:Uncharacterized protein n=1 Tax=Lentibacillus cibarius TaxID=2583219 RepID=A0A549YJ59_9BACI|nr:hypothetical protein [Lentibacillus cibarius]TMN23078.1 hypothetical protein FFL34_14015 [Lentibacillus cibarius]TRM11884.1 hypothetical protein FH966_09415 [Lentibacillus cibarius]